MKKDTIGKGAQSWASETSWVCFMELFLPIPSSLMGEGEDEGDFFKRLTTHDSRYL